MAYLDYVGLAYFKSLLDENYLRTNYEGDTVIDGNVTFTEPIDASVKNDWLGQQIDKTYIKNLRPEDDGEVALIYGDNHEEVITIDTAVTQVRSDANEMYPILLCYDANAEVNQISKSVRYGHNVAINPAYGYVYANSYIVKHPTYNRTISTTTTRVEWASDFRDSVLNPVGQIFEYIDPVSSGGEHRMEFRLYGNPNVAGINTPNINDETNTVSLGVSATRGDALTFFGYAPSTPIYLEDGSTMRKSLVRGDQYGKDIITRDWLNLNGSITGLVHTYMDETIDGYKTFLKTVTINSGDDNNKAGLNVQGDVNIDSGNDANPSNLHVQGNTDIDGNLNVDGDERVHGDLTVDSGDPNDPSHIYVQGEIYHPGENGENPVEYISYITNQQEFRTEIVEHLLPIGKGLAKDADGKIYVDFSQMPTDQFEALLNQLHIPLYIGEYNGNSYVGSDFYVAKNGIDTVDNGYGRSESKPWKTITYATEMIAKNYNINTHLVNIYVDTGEYTEDVSLPLLQRTTGYVRILPKNSSANVTIKGTNSVLFRHTGGAWEICNITLKLVLENTNERIFPSIVITSDSTGYCILRNCPVSIVDNTSNNDNISARLFWVSGGQLIISNYNVYTQSLNAGSWTRSGTGTRDVYWFYVEDAGVAILQRSSTTGSQNIAVSGSFKYFMRCLTNGLIRQVGVGQSMTFSGNCSGQKYFVSTGGSITLDGNDSNVLNDLLPGNENGSVSSSTGSWVNP